MPAIVTNDIRFNGSDNFISSVKNVNQMLYTFIGKTDPWGEAGVDDASTPEKNHNRFLEDSYDIEYMVRVYYSDLSRLMRHVTWLPPTIYDMYDDKQDMSGANFIVVKNNHVYKCLDNNNATATESDSDPSLHEHATTTSGVITTDDGYVWKYMYTIPDGSNNSLDWSSVIDTSVANWVEMDTVNILEECPSQWDVRKNVVSGGIHAFRYASSYPTDLLPVGATVTVSTEASVSGEGFVGKVDSNKRIICDPRKDLATDPGLNYTKIVSVEINGESQYAGTSNTDYINPIFSPPGGHGFNPVRELNGFYILVTTNVSGVNTSYRKVGLISNPSRKKRSDGSDNKSDYIKNDEIVLSEKIGKEFVIADSDYLRGTGEILYIENKPNSDVESGLAVITPDGIKQIKLILSF